MSDFRLNLLAALHVRNKREREPYRDILAQYGHLMECIADLKIQNEHLKKWSGDSANNAPNISTDDRVRQLEQENLKLKEETTDLLRRKSENSQQLIDTKNKLEIREKDVNDLRVKLHMLEQKNKSLEVQHSTIADDMTELQKSNLLINDEHLALQATFDSLESKYRKSQGDLTEVIDRYKELKEKEIERINVENDVYMKKREQQVQREISEATEKMVLPVFDDLKGQLVEESSGEMPINIGATVPTRCKLSFEAHESEVNSIKFAPNGRFFATGGTDRRVKLWEIGHANRTTCKATLTGCNQAVMSIDFDSETTHLVAGSNDYAVRMWSLADNRLRHTFTGHGDKVMAAKFVPGNMQVVSGGHDRTIKLWDLRNRACVHTFFVPSKVYDLVTSEGPGANIISGHYDKKLRLYDKGSRECASQIILNGRITSLDLSCDRIYVLCMCRDETLQYVDMRSNKVVRAFQADGFRTGCDWGRAVLSSDGQFAVAGSSDGDIYVWNVLSGKLERVLPAGQADTLTTCCSWSPAGHSIVTGDKHKMVHIWSDY